ncbi:MAG: DUF4351 domain-containing protein [Desulfobacterales bacterium]|nr:DUF4351 domain-containing protein [Desulfobacterales bacterium]
MKQIINIHDKFIQETFTRDEIAKSFLENYLPKPLLKQVELNTLNIVKDSFIDKELREHLIKGQALGKIVLLIAKYIFKPDLRQKLPEILSLFHAVSNRQTALEILEVLLRYVVQATQQFDEKDIRKLIEQSSIGEDIMQTFIDKYINQGLQQGEAKILLRQMEVRFGTVPKWAKEKIEQADITIIEDWSIRLLNANSQEEVLADDD